MAVTILIIEDNLPNRLLMADVLECRGYEILQAADGLDGIKTAKARKPDLILLDMQMPVMDGIQATRLLKADPSTKDIKILAVTSFAMKGDKERILAAGAEEYIAKPIDTRALPQVIERLLGLGPGHGS